MPIKSEKRVAKCIAHNFWSDGVPVFLLSFLFRFNYFLVVRSTDIDLFIPKLPHYRWLMRMMVKRSGGLVFISKAHKSRFCERWPVLADGAARIEVIPNGINEFWHDNKLKIQAKRPPRACFVGKFSATKNVARLIDASNLVLSEFPDFQLILVGGDQEAAKDILGAELPDHVKVKGKLNSKSELAEIYRGSRVFIMPSLKETFGLVYIEAMSQGCTLVCSRGEGIDGMFSSPCVRSVDPESIVEISDALVNMLREYENGCPTEWIESEMNLFKWENVARRYQDL